MAPLNTFLGMTLTDVAPVTAIPTTAAHLVVWNGEPAGGKTYTLLSLAWTTTTSAAAAFVGQLVANIIAGTQPVPSGTLASGPLQMSGLPAARSKAAVVSAVTLTAGQNASGIWQPVGPTVNSAALTATVGVGAYQNVNGIYQLPPGSMIALAVICGAAGSAKCKIAVTWSEA